VYFHVGASFLLHLGEIDGEMFSYALCQCIFEEIQPITSRIKEYMAAETDASFAMDFYWPTIAD
jgi:hypothetical protein